MEKLCEGLSVSRETIQHLEVLSELTTKWTKSINLVSPATLLDLWERHIVDSAQVYPVAPPNPIHWADIGSGGGYPGLVLAIIGKEKSPETRFTLIESDQRKSTFLRTVIRQTGINAEVLTQRIENAQKQTADVVTARALAPLSQLLEYAFRHLQPEGTALFLKGRRFEQEIEQAQQDWTFALTEIPSITDPEARVLSVKRIRSRAA